MIDGGPCILMLPKMNMFRIALKGGWCYRRVIVSGWDSFIDEAVMNEFSHIGVAGVYAIMDAVELAVVNSSQARHFPKGPVTPRIAPTGRDWLDVGW
jgi:hypothetical protein